jgi:hypothetical protein
MSDLEDGETWRRLNVTFPASITTHSPEQVFYFGADGLLRRLDYTTEVNADDRVAHYTEGYKTFDGLAFPTRRRVYRRNRDSTADRSVTAITLDIHDITAAWPRGGAAAGCHASGREIRSESF